MRTDILKQLQKLKRNWRIGIFWRSISWVILFFLSAQLLNRYFFENQFWILVASIFFAFILLGGLLLRKNFFLKGYTEILRYLNNHYPTLEHSANLLLKKETESILEQLQKEKIEAYFIQHKSLIRLPYQFNKNLLNLGLLIILLGGIFFLEPNMETQVLEAKIRSEQTDKETSDFKLNNLSVRVIPPAYTKLPKQISEKNLKIVEGTAVFWNADFSELPQDVQLLFDQNDSLQLTPDKGSFTASKKIKNSTVYQLQYKKDSILKSTEKAFIQVYADEKPQVEFIDLEPFQKIPFQHNFEIKLKAQTKDDFGITKAKIILTLSRGEGESVKFREVPLPLIGFEKGNKTQQLSSIIRFDNLKVEAGDELYLQFWAKDNKPKGQWSKTDVHIISVEDPNKENLSFQGGLAVDIMPEYFRSQRQIIIDTKQLIEDKASISTQEFKERSNAIASDQKILRLRYGKFLGEENETVIGPMGEVKEEKEEEEHHHDHSAHEHDHNEHHHDDEHKENVVTEKGHEHETPEEHALHAGHDHPEHEMKIGEDKAQFGEAGEELETYYHIHDHADVSTFFDNALKSLLKTSLAIMWDAELQLRLAKPKQAIPYEEKALAYIKEIQKRSRIYVERVGFSPPPLKIVEKRLSGELHELTSKSTKLKLNRVKKSRLFTNAIQLLQSEHWRKEGFRETEIVLLQKVGDSLSVYLLQQKISDLNKLEALSNLIASKGISTAQTTEVENALQLITESIENAQISPTKRAGQHSELLDSYYQQL